MNATVTFTAISPGVGQPVVYHALVTERRQTPEGERKRFAQGSAATMQELQAKLAARGYPTSEVSQ